METVFECEICSKQFKKKGKLNRHVKETHTDNKPYKCEECSAEFKRASHLTRHNRMKHSEEPKSFVCNVDNCLQKFSTKQHLDRHIKILHFGEKLKCEECDVVFNKKILYAKHLSNVHNKAKPFLCPLLNCKKSFFREGDLLNHIKLKHEENNSEESSKRAPETQLDSLSTEAFSESYEKGSENSGLSKVNLKKKRVKKDGEKQIFVCFYEDCMKPFTTGYNLRKHIKTRHLGISEFSCDKCEAKYKHKHTLQEHIARCHSGVKEEKEQKEQQQEQIEQVEQFELIEQKEEIEEKEEIFISESS